MIEMDVAIFLLLVLNRYLSGVVSRALTQLSKKLYRFIVHTHLLSLNESKDLLPSCDYRGASS